MNNPMTDEELAKALGLTPEEAAVVIPRLTPEKRRAYEMLSRSGDKLILWEQGLGPIPEGVLVDFDRRKR